MKEKILKLKRMIATLLVLCLVFPYQYVRAISTSDIMQGFGVDKAISGTYGYANGILVQKIDNTTGNKIIFDRGQFRAVVDKEGNLLSLAVYGTDNVNSIEDLKKLVSNVTGITGEALDNLFKGINDKGEAVATPTWLGEAIKWLNSGSNYSININFGEGGPSVTFVKDGKEQYAKNFLGVVTSEWVYNKDGSLAKVKSLTYENCTADTPGAIKKVGADGKEYYVKEVYNEVIYENGQAKAVYEISSSGERTLVGKYEYNNSGELLSYTDYKNSQKTLYSGGKPYAAVSLGGNLQQPVPVTEAATEVPASEATQNGSTKSGYFKVGDKYYKLKDGYGYDINTGSVFKVGAPVIPGTVVTVWNYKANGALDTVEGRDKAGAWTTTVFDSGRAIAVFNGRYSNGDVLREYINKMIELSIQAANGNVSAQQQLQKMHETNVYGLKSIYLYNDQVKQWISKYGEAKTAVIICNLFNWNNNGQYGGAAAVATANTIINMVKNFGFNGSQMAAVGTFTNTLNQSDNNNASFVVGVTIYAAGQAMYDLNTAVLDGSYEELLANLGIDWSQLNVDQIINTLMMLEIENVIIAEYRKILEAQGKTQDEINALIEQARADFRNWWNTNNGGIVPTPKPSPIPIPIPEPITTESENTTSGSGLKTPTDATIMPILPGEPAPGGNPIPRPFPYTSIEKFCAGLGLSLDTIKKVINPAIDAIVKKYAEKKELYAEIIKFFQNPSSANLEQLATVIRGINEVLNDLISYVTFQLDEIQKIVDLMPDGEDSFRIAFYRGQWQLTEEQTKIYNQITNMLNKLGAPKGATIYERMKLLVDKRLGGLTSLLSKFFKNFDISYKLNLIYDKSTDWQKNALNVVWKKGMTNIISSLKSQITTRLQAMISCYRSGNLDGLKNLNSNIVVTDNQKYSHDPSIAGTLQNVVEIDGKYYAVVSADYIDIMDGLGAQDAEGELIYVEISAELASQIKDKIGGSVMFMGDVAADTNGHLTITMNVEYGGGYRDLGNASKAEMKSAMDNLKNEAWYGKVLDQMKEVWANITAQYGGYSNWRQGFEFLRNYATGGGVVLNF